MGWREDVHESVFYEISSSSARRSLWRLLLGAADRAATLPTRETTVGSYPITLVPFFSCSYLLLAESANFTPNF